MGRFRYRTSVLLGPWRSRREQAVADAIRSGQADRAETGARLVWRVNGMIEQEDATEAR